MKIITNKTLINIGHLFACLVMLLAVYSVNSTCMFMTYQPDVPEKLKKI